MLILNGRLVTWTEPNQIILGQALRIDQGVIQSIGPQDDLLAKYPSDERIDARGQLVMPGNICAHTHFYGAFSRGMNIPGLPAKDFPEILEKLWWRLDKSLNLEDVKYSAYACLVDAIKHGTTTLFDHHASPNAIRGSLFTIADAVTEAGVRASLCYEVTDRDGEQKCREGIEENREFISYIHRNQPASDRLSATFGLHASLTLSEDTLAAVRQAIPDQTGFHIHVAEHSVDEYDSLNKCGQRVVDRLERHGILGENSIVVHAVHVDAREIAILERTHTFVTHQPRSNMNNAVGLPQTESMMRAGVKVCLGNDGFSNAMWEEWNTAYLAHKLWNADPRRMGGCDITAMAIHNNRDLANQHFRGAPLGTLEEGAAADLIFVEYHEFTELTADNLPWHIIFGFNPSMVTATFVAGKPLMLNRELLTLDEEKIVFEARRLSKNTWQRFTEISLARE
jgi:putative selenium metabolism protein SsnA